MADSGFEEGTTLDDFAVITVGRGGGAAIDGVLGGNGGNEEITADFAGVSGVLPDVFPGTLVMFKMLGVERFSVALGVA